MRTLPLALAVVLSACAGGGPGAAKDAIDDIDADGFGAADDCDDYDASVHPDAAERCNGADDDCDDEIDEGALRTFYADADDDGYGDPAAPTEACDAPADFVEDASDCDDGDAATSPDAPETCDGEDEDCDGDVDDDPLDADTFYADADADGFGDANVTAVACDLPDGFVDVAGDCDDADALANPAGVEVCGGADEDCDGETDEADAAGSKTWYADGDADGWGDDTVATDSCTAPDGYVDDAGDCDDADAASSPDGAELCGGGDEDCDGETDEADAAPRTWYADGDGDGFGDDGDTVFSCDGPGGYVFGGGDCDDDDAAVSPDAAETCNDVDDDCDGAVDVGASDESTWHLDADDDGYGSATTTTACDLPAGYVADAGDCDDADADVSPAAGEVCNGVDDDCDGDVDVDATDAPTWYADGDGDGYGSATSSEACDAPSGYVAGAGDCDDADDAANPGEAEVCGGADEDCDGATDEGCPETHCGPVATDETWDASVAHEVTCDVTVSATLTIADGATVTFDPGAEIAVAGTLDVGAASLDGGVTVSPGGAASFDGATVGGPVDATSGTLLVAGGTFSDLVSVSLENAGGLDGAATYTEVAVAGGALAASATWAALGVPWTVSSDVSVGGGATLTVATGATLAFEAGAGLEVGEGGLVGSGVTFTSARASPAAGDWDGLTFGDLCATVALDGVTIAYGGGNGLGNVAFVS
ncbi:MAG: putative metal-binding motif-containing protein, partial [Myxococcota bacterium]